MDPYIGDCWNNFKFINHNGILPAKNTKKLPFTHNDQSCHSGYISSNSASFVHLDRRNIL